jgi:hypothetical protein
LTKTKLLLFGLALIAATAGALAVLRVGDLGLVDSRIAAKNGSRDFDLAAWHTRDPVVRGHMLAALAERHRFVGYHRDSVEALLGEGNDCYVGYEDEPCYELQLGHSAFELQFPVNHSSAFGRVLDMRLVKR